MINTIDLCFLNEKKTIASFAIDTTDGVVLVETGPHSTIKNLEKGLVKIGKTLEDVRHVLLTHIHLDHAGAAWVFAQKKAKIYVHPFGIRHLHSPEKLMHSARRIYKEKMDMLWGEMHPISMEKLHATENGEVLKIGNLSFIAHHTPGHAVHHIAWQLDNNLFTGDVAGVKIGKGIPVPPCPPPDINIEDWQKSIALIRNLPIDTLYLTHFDKITNVDEHLTQLETILLKWAKWIRPYYEKNISQSDLLPLFQKMVTEDLQLHGLSEIEIKRYEIANPSWMAVAGLMRYWKKRLQ